MRINTNMAALNAWRTMTNNAGNLQKSLERLASGYRLNRAADDAAGLAVSEKMNAQIRGLGMALRNTQDAISLVQTAEGGAAKVQEMMQRMRELAVQAGSDTLQDSDRAKLQEEFAALQAEIDRTADTVTFNGRKLIDGSSGDQATLQAGAVGLKNVRASGLNANISNRTLNLAAGSVTLATATTINDVFDIDGATGGTQNLGNASLGLNDAANFNGGLNNAKMYISQAGKVVEIDFEATDAITGSKVKDLTLSQFIEHVNSKLSAAGVSARAQINGGGNNFNINGVAVGTANDVSITLSGFAAGTNTGTKTAATDASIAAGQLTDLATGTALVANTHYTISGNKVTGKAGTIYEGISFEFDASVASASITGKIDIQRNNLSFQVGANTGESIKTSFGNLTTANLGISSLDINISDRNAADQALTALDNALSVVSSERAKMGATQNRLENTIANLQTQSENLTAANSRIRDLDMASEMAQFTKFQILAQASTAMLAQANQITQGVLSLLR